ncbi:MAG: cytochrome c oxidase assembly protein [Pseudomonadota bacterium]
MAGTTQVANAAPGQILADHPMTVRFDANRNRALPVRFEAVQPHLKVKPGESSLAFYQATNTSDKPLVAQATFNVTPQKAGLFFNKIDCFCFEEQFLAPGQSVDMPVVFFIDPDIASDRDAKEIRTVTLSYTFFEVDDPSEAMQQRMLSYDAASTLPEGTASDGPRG